MPYPNEHACRLKRPGDFQSDSFRRTTRKHNKKSYSVVMGRLKGEETMTEQAYRYPKDTWDEDDARAHCETHDGAFFEAASGDEKSASLDEFIRAVRDAWEAQFLKPNKGDGEMVYNAWVQTVLDDGLVVSEKGGLYLYPYSIDKETGAITFESPQPVRRVEKYEPVSAADVPAITIPNLNLKAHLARPSLHLQEIKSTPKGSIVGGYMALWGNPDNRDIQEDFFTAETNFWLEHFPKVPAIFHHGKDLTVGKSVLGYRDDAQVKDDGLWVQDWLDKSNQYWSIIKALLDAGKLYYSPGSIPHLVERAPDGEVKSYPIVDDTFTPMPAQFALGLRERPLDFIKSAYAEAGLEFVVPDPLRGRLGNSLTGDEEQERELALAKLRLTKTKLLTY